MTADETTEQPSIIFCSCAYFDVIPQGTKEQVLGTLQAAGVAVEAVADLCGLAAGRDARLHRWAQADSVAIVACYPRAVRWLFEAAGMPLEDRKVLFFNMRTQSSDEILAGLIGDDTLGESGEAVMPGKEEGWVPWFPVIDYDRCENCKQCVSFCLFGTYGLSAEGQVQVQNPAGCKTNCPACARICPAQAIIFPKYAESPINGAEITEADTAARKSAPDLRAMLQGNVYERIRQRHPGRQRFSTEPQETPTAQPDRSCPTLDALCRDLDIPREVLVSLSPAELQRLRKTSQSDGSDGSPNQNSD